MIELTLPKILDHLKKEKFDPKLQSETDQIYFIFKIEGHEFPLFVRIYDESDLLQLLVFFPAPIKEGTEADVARLLHLLNKEIDIPGLGMEEESRMAFYRVMLPALDKKINDRLLDAFLDSMRLICEHFAPVVFAVTQGKVTFQEVLEKSRKEIGDLKP